MLKRISAIVLALALASIPPISAYAQSQPFPASGGGSGGGTGDVTGPASSTNGNFPSFNGTSGKTLQDSTYGPSSFAVATRTIGTGNGLQGGGDLSANRTISLAVTNNAQTGASYAVQSTDGGVVILRSNAGAMSDTIAQANGAGFTSGFGATVANINASGGSNVTLTATTSTFGNGLTALTILPGQVVDFASNSTNYPFTAVSLPVTPVDNIIGNFTGTANYPGVGALTSCSTASSALTYSTTTHAFGCNSISGGSVTGTAGNATYFSATNTLGDGGSAVVSMGGINLTSSTTTGLTNGMYLSSANVLQIRAASSNKFQIASGGVLYATGLVGATAGSPKLADAAASATVPTLIPNQSATTTGWGAQASGNISGIVGGAEKMRLDSNGASMQAGVFTLKGFTVATLPASPATGSLAYVTDQTAACSFGATPAGSGSNTCKVWYNGTAWIDG